MSIFYNSLPLPVYLFITFIIPIMLVIYILRNRKEYPLTMVLGIVFLSLSAFSAGIIRVFSELNIVGEFVDALKSLPIPLVLLTIVFVLIGAYRKVRHDEVKRRKILIISLLQVFIILSVGLVILIKTLEN